MEIKKFEARTMKEAIEMVKAQLGPEAIILSAKDNKKKFGLVGEGSVEVTAAVSETTLRKKQFAESRINEVDRRRLAQAPVKSQKEFINKMVSNYQQTQQPAREVAVQAPRPPTTRRYIDIDDPVNAVVDRVGFKSTNSGPQFDTDSLTQGEFNSLKSEISNLKDKMGRTNYPGADQGLSYEVSFSFEKLLNAGVSAEQAAELLNEAQEAMTPLKLKNKNLVDAWIAKKILETTSVVSSHSHRTKYQIFVGPSGTGKTSHLIKMAAQELVEYKSRIALVTTDTYKVGALEQMKIYAQILNVPLIVVRNQNQWPEVEKALSGFDRVFVDTPGMSLRQVEENSVIRSLVPEKSLLMSQIHLVLNAQAKDSDLAEMGRRFRLVRFDDVIFTYLDETVQQGCIYNFIRKFQTPLHSFGIGPKVPEDFEWATAERLLDLILKLTHKLNHEKGLNL